MVYHEFASPNRLQSGKPAGFFTPITYKQGIDRTQPRPVRIAGVCGTA